jgi:hypothetical protein
MWLCTIPIITLMWLAKDRLDGFAPVLMLVMGGSTIATTLAYSRLALGKWLPFGDGDPERK